MATSQYDPSAGHHEKGCQAALGTGLSCSCDLLQERNLRGSLTEDETGLDTGATAPAPDTFVDWGIEATGRNLEDELRRPVGNVCPQGCFTELPASGICGVCG